VGATNLHTDATLWGTWCDAIAGGPVVVGHTTDTGVVLRFLTSATMVQSGADCVETTTDCCDIVVGMASTTKAYWAARLGTAVGDGDIIVGQASVGDTTTSALLHYYGGGDYANAAVRWGIAHQPVTLANGRTYLTLVAATGSQGIGDTGTWQALDITGIEDGFTPSIAAGGPVEGTYPHLQPSRAFASDDSWQFPSVDFTQFELSETGGDIDGLWVTRGITEVRMSAPRAATAGASTVISGSIPHHVARGRCGELGFPFVGGRPGLSIIVNPGGAVGIGDYGLQAVWRWTDEAGQVHRSAPSAIQTATVTGGNNTIVAVVTNPQLTTKSQVHIELYSTGDADGDGTPDPTADAQHILQQSVAVDTDQCETAITINTQPVTVGEFLYTDGGVFAHYPVPGDGGVATVGRRLWMAGGGAVYGSKLLVPGYAPSFNDEGPLQVNLPAGAGRVLALEGLEDKLVIFCERGIYATQDGGPDNTGAGPDIAFPVRVSDLGCAGPRSTCVTDQGVIFCSPLDATDPQRGGPWVLDRTLGITGRQYLGKAVLPYFDGTWVPEVAFSPERQQVYVSVHPDDGGIDGSGVVVIDLRSQKFAVWDMRVTDWGALRSVECIGGVLWALSNEPAAFAGPPGSDSSGGAYAMTIKTKDLAADGRDGLGWSRVRSVSVLGTRDSGTHTLTYTAELDGCRELTGSDSITAQSASTTWPTNRQAPEWRLPSQKCSTIAVQLSATPAVAQWAAIRLDVAPLPKRGPAKNRS
jgi:hypothetical protein